MKFTLPDKGHLADLVSWASTAVPSRPTLPILACVKLTVTGDGAVTAYAYDYDASASAEVLPGVVTDAEPGLVLANARRLAGVVGKLPAGQAVRIDTPAENKIRIRCGGFTGTFGTYPDDDFPILPAITPADRVVDGDWLRAAIGRVVGAATRDDTLPSLTCVRIEMYQDKVILVATDRYRVAVATVKLAERSYADDDVVMVSAATLDKWAKTGCPAGQPVGLSIMRPDGAGTGMFGLSTAGRTMTVSLSGGEFPRWGSLTHRGNFKVPVTVNAADLVAAINRAVEVLPPRGAAAVVLLDISDGKVRVRVHDDNESSEEDLEAAFTGDPVTLAFNPSYLVDAVRAATDNFSDDVVFKLPVTEKPAVSFTSGDPTDLYDHVLMPIRDPRAATAQAEAVALGAA